MESNPFSIDIVDSFASDVPESDRLILHSDVFDSLEAILEEMRDREAALRRVDPTGTSAPGQVVLLVAPAAGYGKTYFLARAGRALSEEFEMVSLRFQKGTPIGWSSVFTDLVEHCCQVEAPSGELRLIDELARRVFADLTAHLIRSGEVPAPNPEEAVRALTDKPLEVFDFSNAEGQVVQWFCSVFEPLLPSIAAEAQRRYGMTREASVFWLRALFEHSQEVAKMDGASPGTKRFSAGLGGDEDGNVLERLSGLGRLLCRWRPAIFIADHLDSFFGDSKRGGELARLLADLGEVIPGSLTVVSVNQDLWDATFRGSLPGAIEDRLTSEALTLRGMSPEEAKQLVEQRLADAGISDERASGFLPWVEAGVTGDLSASGDLSPRQFLRWAKEQWDAFVASGYGAPEVSRTEKGNPKAPTDESRTGGHSAMPDMEYVSLSEEAFQFKHGVYEPLEPLVFDRHLTLRPKRFKVPRREEVESPSKLDEEVTAPRREAAGDLPERSEETEQISTKEEGSDLEGDSHVGVSGEQDKEEQDRESPSEGSIANAIDFQEVAGESAIGDSPAVGGGVDLFGEGAPGEPEVESVGEMEREAEAEAEKVKDLGPDLDFGASEVVEKEAVPELSETVENLKAEAQKAFFEFHEIFKEAMSPEGSEASSAALEREVEAEASVEVEPKVAPEAAAEAVMEEEEAAEKEPEVAVDGGGSLAEEYNRLRREVLGGLEPGDFDLVRFYAVLNGVGELLPVISQNEFDLPENPGFRVLEWSNESQLVFFGLLSVKNSNYWNALIRYASRFIDPESGGATSGRAQAVKVVVLAQEGHAVEATHWQRELSELGGRFPSIDVIQVDQETVAAVYASAQLLEEARNHGRAGRSEKVLRFAIRELDFFWRRLTRGS